MDFLLQSALALLAGVLPHLEPVRAVNFLGDSYRVQVRRSIGRASLVDDIHVGVDLLRPTYNNFQN